MIADLCNTVIKHPPINDRWTDHWPLQFKCWSTYRYRSIIVDLIADLCNTAIKHLPIYDRWTNHWPLQFKCWSTYRYWSMIVDLISDFCYSNVKSPTDLWSSTSLISVIGMLKNTLRGPWAKQWHILHECTFQKNREENLAYEKCI